MIRSRGSPQTCSKDGLRYSSRRASASTIHSTSRRLSAKLRKRSSLSCRACAAARRACSASLRSPSRAASVAAMRSNTAPASRIRSDKRPGRAPPRRLRLASAASQARGASPASRRRRASGVMTPFRNHAGSGQSCGAPGALPGEPPAACRAQRGASRRKLVVGAGARVTEQHGAEGPVANGVAATLTFAPHFRNSFAPCRSAAGA